MTWVPVLIVIILVFVVATILYKKNNIGKDQFDERQEMIRKKAYKYSAMTMLFCSLFYYILCTLSEKQYMEDGVSVLLVALLGVAVFAIYSIFNDSFFGFRGQRGAFSQPGSYMILVSIIVIANGIGSVRMFQEHQLIKKGVLTSNVINLALTILFLAILIALVIKYLMNRNENRSAEQ